MTINEFKTGAQYITDDRHDSVFTCLGTTCAGYMLMVEEDNDEPCFWIFSHTDYKDGVYTDLELGIEFNFKLKVND